MYCSCCPVQKPWLFQYVQCFPRSLQSSGVGAIIKVDKCWSTLWVYKTMFYLFLISMNCKRNHNCTYHVGDFYTSFPTYFRGILCRLHTGSMYWSSVEAYHYNLCLSDSTILHLSTQIYVFLGNFYLLLENKKFYIRICNVCVRIYTILFSVSL